jgi:high-affinity iron transporter
MAQMERTRSELRTTLGEAYDAPVPGLDAADPVRGATVYQQACASCHGATGKGDGASAAGLEPSAADFTDAFHARYYSDAGRVRIIEQGSPGTAMAGFASQLDQGRILDVYAYVRQFREHGSAAGHEGGDHDHGAHGH